MSAPTLPRLRRADGTAALLSALDEAGAVTVEDLVPKREIRSILDEVRPHVEAADPEMTHINDVLKGVLSRRSERHLTRRQVARIREFRHAEPIAIGRC